MTAERLTASLFALRTRSMTRAMLWMVPLAVALGACKAEPLPTLELHAPEMAPAIATTEWPPAAAAPPPATADAVKGTLTIKNEVEQVGTGGIELHARVEVVAHVTLTAGGGAVRARVESAEVKMTPPVGDRSKALAAALAGQNVAAIAQEGRVRLEPADPRAPAAELARALTWLLPRALGPDGGSLAVPLQLPGGDATLAIELKADGHGQKDGRHAARTNISGTATGAARAPLGAVQAAAQGWAQEITSPDGALVAADGAITVRLEAAGAGEDTVRQLTTTTVSFAAEAP